MNRKNLIVSIIIAIIAGFSVTSIINFFHKGDVNVFKLLLSIPLKVYLVSFFIFFSSYLLEAIRMQYLLRHRGYKVSFFSVLYNNIMGYFFSYLTPFAMGGQPFQVYHLTTLKVPSSYATGIMAARLLQNSIGASLIAIIMLNTSMAWLLEKGKIIFLGITISLISAGVLITAMFFPGVLKPLVRLLSSIFKKPTWYSAFEKWVEDFKENIEYMWKKNTYMMVIDSIGWFAVIAIQLYSLFYILKSAFNIGINYWFLFGSINAVNAFAYFIPTPGSSGGIEATYQVVLASITGDAEVSLKAIVGWRFIAYYLQIALGSVLLWKNLKSTNKDTGMKL